MFIGIYSKTGHFNGMTVAMVTKDKVLIQSDKWGMTSPFDTAEEVQEAFDAMLERDAKSLRSAAEAAYQRNPRDTVEAWYQRQLAIHPPCFNLRIMKLTEVTNG